MRCPRAKGRYSCSLVPFGPRESNPGRLPSVASGACFHYTMARMHSRTAKALPQGLDRRPNCLELNCPAA